MAHWEGDPDYTDLRHPGDLSIRALAHETTAAEVEERLRVQIAELKACLVELNDSLQTLKEEEYSVAVSAPTIARVEAARQKMQELLAL